MSFGSTTRLRAIMVRASSDTRTGPRRRRLSRLPSPSESRAWRWASAAESSQRPKLLNWIPLSGPSDERQTGRLLVFSGIGFIEPNAGIRLTARLSTKLIVRTVGDADHAARIFAGILFAMA